MDDRQECYIQGIGTAVPPLALGPSESAELLKHACRTERAARLLRRVIRLTGIETRHLAALDQQVDGRPMNRLYLPVAEQPDGPGMGARNALFDKAASPMVAEALGAFSNEQLGGIDVLVTASCTHASSPGLERPVFQHSPIRPSVDRWNLGFMGCSAALGGMRLVHQMRALSRPALVLACELSSLHFQYSESLDQMTANVLFSDGTAAMVLSPQRSAVRVVDCRCAALPEAADQMVWFADDHGLRLELSQDLPDTLAGVLPGVVDGFLSDHQLAHSGIDHWLVHPGGPQILDAVANCLNLPDGALSVSWDVFRNYGNMSSPTIFFIMRKLFDSKVDGTCVALAFGPGLTIEMALLEINRGEK